MVQIGKMPIAAFLWSNISRFYNFELIIPYGIILMASDYLPKRLQWHLVKIGPFYFFTND